MISSMEKSSSKKYTYWYKKEVVASNLGEAERKNKKHKVILDSVTVEEIKHESGPDVIGFAVEQEEEE